MLYSCYLPCYIICYIGLPPMLSTILYTTYSVYHARMGGVAVLDEILDKLSIDLFLPGEVFYNMLAGSEKTRRLPVHLWKNTKLPSIPSYIPCYIPCYIGYETYLHSFLDRTWNSILCAWFRNGRILQGESLTQHCRSPTDPSWALLEQGRCHHLKGVSLAYLGQFHSLHSPCDPPGPLAVALAVELGLAAGAELALPKHKKSQFISVCKCRPPVILKLIHFIC